MKTKLFIFSFIILAASTLSARVLTVCNAPISGGHFTNLQIAIDSANVGDTVDVMGAPNGYNSYGEGRYGNNDIHIMNKITLIGAGYAVTGTQHTCARYLTGTIYFDSNSSFTIQLSGTRILRMDVNYGTQYQNYGAPNDVDIERCYFGNWINVYGHG